MIFGCRAALGLLVPAFVLLACGAAPAPAEASGDSAEALNGSAGLDASCHVDSDCQTPLFCDLLCPVLPGRPHCQIVGGKCEPACARTPATLAGTSFASVDQTVSVTFTSTTAFTRVPPCPVEGVHCTPEIGTYSVSNGVIALSATRFAFHEALTVDPHCYDGLFDPLSGEQLFPQ
jgi:hypothetical protein